jgi:hypothetical protein
MKSYPRSFSVIMAVAVVLVGFEAASAQDTVTLVTSDDCYVVGDTVSFTLTNNLDSTIYMPHSPVWSIWDATGDTLVYPSTVFWVVVPFGADSSETYKWPQIDYHLNQVPQGPYWVEVTYSPQLEPWNPAFTVTDSFYVGGASVTEQGTWGSIKSMYR